MKRALSILLPVLLQAQQAAPQRFSLPNGMQAVLFEDHSLPLLRGELRLALPPPGQDPEAWLRPLGFRMLEAGGSGARSASAAAQAADAIGLNLRPVQDSDTARWAFSVRSQDQETAMALLADRVMRPAFDPLALETARGQAWSELSASNALETAKLRFARALAALPEPDEQMLGAVDGRALSAWHGRLFRPSRATLVLWGDADLPQARQLALLSFGAWPESPAVPPKPSSNGAERGPFLAALPGEAPAVSLGLVDDGTDTAARRRLRAWMETQLRAGGLAVSGDGGPLVVSLSAPLGTSAESLRARIAAALDALPAAFTDRDFALVQTQSEHQAKLRGLHPAQLIAAAGDEAPLDAAAARAALQRWCAAGNRRLFASGDPGSLSGLQAVTPKR